MSKMEGTLCGCADLREPQPPFQGVIPHSKLMVLSFQTDANSDTSAWRTNYFQPPRIHSHSTTH